MILIVDVLSPSGEFDSFVTSWTAAHQAPLSMEFLGPRTLEWVDISSSKKLCVCVCVCICVCVFKVETHTLDVRVGEFTETSLMGKGNYHLKRLSVH